MYSVFLWLALILYAVGILLTVPSVLRRRPALSPAVLAGWVLDDRLPVRVQIQLHRLLWPDQDRGR